MRLGSIIWRDGHGHGSGTVLSEGKETPRQETFGDIHMLISVTSSLSRGERRLATCD